MSALHFARRHRASAHGPRPGDDEDPLAGMANLFDVSLAFIVALLLLLFSLLSVEALLDPERSVTVLTRTDDGEMTLITQDRERIEVQRVTDRELSGAGTRLGIAYRLPGGEVVYVPEEGS